MKVRSIWPRLNLNVWPFSKSYEWATNWALQIVCLPPWKPSCFREVLPDSQKYDKDILFLNRKKSGMMESIYWALLLENMCKNFLDLVLLGTFLDAQLEISQIH